eukprot:14358502-Alexandrium_andersonii.AAC.1
MKREQLSNVVGGLGDTQRLAVGGGDQSSSPPGEGKTEGGDLPHRDHRPGALPRARGVERPIRVEVHWGPTGDRGFGGQLQRKCSSGMEGISREAVSTPETWVKRVPGE